MKSIEQVIQAAHQQGLLPADAVAPALEARPWPVILLTAIGAWFAAIPLLAMISILFGELLNKGAGTYIIGALVLVAAVTILRARDVSLFVEQLAVPALLIGGGTLSMGLFRDMTTPGAALILALLASAIAWMTPRQWLRVLLGAAACGLLVLATMPTHDEDMSIGMHNRLWLAWQLSVVAWLAAQWATSAYLRGGKMSNAATAMDAFATGWILTSLLGLALWSGMSFMVGASINVGGGAHASRHVTLGWSGIAIGACSVAATLGAAAWIALRWQQTRKSWLAAVALLIAGMAWQLPALGAVIGVMAYCASTGRLKLAAAAGLAAAWVIGSYYYQLDYPLAAKAMSLMGTGAVFGLLAWSATAKGTLSIPKTAGTGRGGIFGMVVGLLAVLVVANGAIWQKEELIAKGAPVFVELAPADPRSLMQGDFMRLNYRLPIDQQTRALSTIGAERPHIVAVRDARGVASILRMHDGNALSANEFLIELTPHQGGWMLVSDAWFFKEGEAARWAAAKYGEFRVMPDGRALLVGLRGAKLEEL